MDGRGRYVDNILVERLWRPVKYEEVYLKAYANAVEARRGLGEFFLVLQRPEGPTRPPGRGRGQALDYRSPAEVFHEGQVVREEESNERRCSQQPVSVSLTGAVGLSLNSASVQSNQQGPPN